jgi:hypothetical protein
MRKLAMKETKSQGQEQLAKRNQDYHTYLMFVKASRSKH